MTKLPNVATDTQIAVLNSSTLVSDDDVQKMLGALEAQWNYDVAPVWSVNECKLSFYAKGKKPPTNAWQLVFLDDADQANALAYHDVTSSGCPISKVFARTAKLDGASLSVCASHELCEMAVDPDCSRIFQATTGSLYAAEVCDPCESDGQGYLLDGVLLSDFVTPRWFGLTLGPSKVFDYCGRIKRPYQILTGGYAQTYESDYGWTQLGREVNTLRGLGAVRGSRRERRKRGRAHWVHSEPRDRE